MIEANYFWSNVVVLAIGTLTIRGSIIAISSKIVLSERAKELFSYIPAAILPGFIVPSAFSHEGAVVWAYGKERLLVLMVAVGVSYYSRSTLLTIASGLASLYVLTQLLV